MRLLRPSPRLALLRLRALSVRDQRLQLVVRAFSDAADPAKRQPGEIALSSALTSEGEHPNALNGFSSGGVLNHANGVNGNNGTANGWAKKEQLQLLDDQLHDEHEPVDADFAAQRMGFPISDEEHNERAAGERDVYEDSIREESRAEATEKAERIMAIMRHSMSELKIGKVIHRIAQYATLPRVTALSRKQFLRSLETRFGDQHAKEYAYMMAFLQGRDDIIEQLEIDSRKGGADAATVAAIDGEPADGVAAAEKFVVPEIMGLHPDLVSDPQFVSIVFCYCRLACLNSLKLVQRPAAGYNRASKSSLWQVKADFRKVLDMEGFGHFAEMMGLEKPPPQEGEDGDLDVMDAEWEEFNLENDRIDFRMLVAQTQELVAFMKRELPNETISKMLIAMLASVKTSKLHRKIFQEMVNNIQTAFPTQYHEQVLSELVPFLSGDNATYEDFDSAVATNALHHHQMRNEAIVRALLESRMRVGHILIHDIDDVEPTQSVSAKLTPEQREKVITVAWNIVSVLDDRKYHMFFTRFLKYKLAWRPSRATFGETFVDDVRKTLGPRHAAAIMPVFEEVYQHLSVETLTICKVKARHARKVLRGRGALEPLTDAGRERLETTWQPSHCAFYRNLPFGVTKRHLEEALSHIGGVKRFFIFSNPITGAPSDDEMTKLRAKSPKDMHALRKKKHIIASDQMTSFHAVVEFDSESTCQKATMRALRIFGVMMAGWKEYRPVFSTPAENRANITLQNIPYGKKVGELVDEVNEVLAAAGLRVNTSGMVPRGVLLTNGRLDLRFPSFVEAAHVAELLNDHVRGMASRRALPEEEKQLQQSFLTYKTGLEKEKKVADKEKKRQEAAELEEEEEEEESEEEDVAAELDEEDDDSDEDADVVLDDEDDEDEEVEGDDEKKKAKKRPVWKVSETDHDYFQELLEAEKQFPEQPEQLRPFDVTWTPMPRARNKHMYL